MLSVIDKIDFVQGCVNKQVQSLAAYLLGLWTCMLIHMFNMINELWNGSLC